MTREEILSKAKQILFSTEMVRAILNDRKTVTRRPIKPPVEVHERTDGIFVTRPRNFPDEYCRFVPYEPYKVGDYLYVRETWAAYSRTYGTMPTLIYKADGNSPNGIKWHPSIHMPKEAARIFLRVTNVRVERLQDIITGDYKTPLNINREGLISPCCNCTHHNGDCKDFIANNTCRLVDSYIDLWNSTVKKTNLDKYGWEANPWVWVITFKKVEVE